MIAALFVDARGAYANLPGVEVWDIKRDARNYDGPHPVICHSPCSTWCQVAHVNQARYGHRVGNDGGCFASALANVRRVGGVLEHPAESIAWRAFELTRPIRYAWTRSLTDGGWVTEVSQRAYGHRARKATWLYAVAVELPIVNWSDPAPLATVSYLTNHGGGDLPRLSKKEAKATPLPFRDLLLSIARTAQRRAA